MAEKLFTQYLKQLVKDFEQKSEFNQMAEVLEERVKYLHSILLKLKDSKLELFEKYNAPIPDALSELDIKKLELVFEDMLATRNPPKKGDDIIYQLLALIYFYEIILELKLLPPPSLLLTVDNLSMQAVYFAGVYTSIEPFHASKFVRLHKSNIRTGEKKEIWTGIILKAAKRKNILPGKIPRVEQLRIYKEIEKMIDEGVLSDKELSSLKDKKPPSIDTIKERMMEVANF